MASLAITDTYVNENPTAEEVAEIARMAESGATEAEVADAKTFLTGETGNTRLAVLRGVNLDIRAGEIVGFAGITGLITWSMMICLAFAISAIAG